MPADARRKVVAALNRPASQQPQWPDEARLHHATALLQNAPPLVTSGEIDLLRGRLATIARGEGFLLQGGDGAESFAANTEPHIRGTVETLLQMGVLLSHRARVPVVHVGRLAGQYAKAVVAHHVGTGLPPHRGDAINSVVPGESERAPDPGRMVRAYANACATMNLVRATAGSTDLRAVHGRITNAVSSFAESGRYRSMIAGIDRSLSFMTTYGVADRQLAQTTVYAGHEALLLDYESALVRADEEGRLYSGSGHLLWIGEHTHGLDESHIAFAELLSNPIGLELGPATSPEQAVAYVRRLDREREPGRLSLICRLGDQNVRRVLPEIVEKVEASGHQVIWLCDPMHRNTRTSPAGYPTRHFDRILHEVRGFFEVHHALGTHPGGVHIELTGDDVTECLGGTQNITDNDLGARYETASGPRLNGQQALELAFLVAEMLPGGDWLSMPRDGGH